MKFGCSSLLYGGYDLDTTLAGLQKAGYEGLELCAIPGMGQHFEAGQPESVYLQIREKLAAHDLSLESVGCSGALGTERFEPLMEAAALIGAPYMTLGSGGVADDEEGWQELLAITQAALPVCDRTGVKLSVKPHVRAVVHNTATARRLMEELDSPWVGLNLDNTHLQRDGDDPVAAVADLRPWVFTARVRDFRSSDLSIGPIEAQIPGKGQADIAGYLQALEQVPGLEFVTVEMVGTKEYTLAEVQRVVGEALTALRAYR